MRFRQKFPWSQVATAVVWIGLGCFAWTQRRHSGIPMYGVIGLGWLFVLLFGVAGYWLIWWDVSDSGLTERRLWRTRFIPWEEVYRVGPWRPFRKSRGDTIEIEFARTGPLSDRGHFVLLPLERQGLLDAIRAHAPQATVEL